MAQTNTFATAAQQQQQQQQQQQPPQQQQIQLQQASLAQNQATNQINFFQDVPIQTAFRTQTNAFQIQQSQFVASQPNQQRSLINRNPRAQIIQQANQPPGQPQLQAVAPGQQTIRLMNRGGGMVGGQRRAGGPNQAQNQPGLSANPNPSNPAQRGGRNNF